MSAFFAIFLVAAISRGPIKGAAFIVGAAIGSMVSLILEHSPQIHFSRQAVALPAVFAWGQPTLQQSVIAASMITGLLLLPNLLASLRTWEIASSKKVPTKDIRLAILVNGAVNIIAGVFAVPGFGPYATSASILSFTKSAARLPFMIASTIILLLGFLPDTGRLAVSVPEGVAYAILLASFSQVLVIGMRDAIHRPLDADSSLAIAAPILLGIGIMQVPPKIWQFAGKSIGLFIGNGIIVGFLSAVVLFIIIDSFRNAPWGRD